MKTFKIRLFEPYVGKEELNQTLKVLKTKFWASGSGQGQVKKFELALKKYITCIDVIAVNSGTAALHLALSNFDIALKDVMIPTLTFVSTAHAAIYNNAKPIFVDIDEKTLCIDLDDLERKITKNTKIIIPVHFGGFPCDLEKIKKLKNEFKFHVIEDASHAFGATYKGKKIGKHSELVCFSFHPVKNLSAPTGGAIAINNDMIRKDELNSKRWCGITDRKESLYDVDKLGWNFYMNEISATIGLVQLKRINILNNRRKKIAKQYYKKITLEHKMPFSEECSYHLYWIRVKNRDEFMKKMRRCGIETGIHYKPVHQMKFYFKEGRKLEKADNIWTELVSIPMHPNLTMNDVEEIITNVNNFAC